MTIKQSHGGSGKQARASSTGSRPTSSRSRWRTTSTPSPAGPDQRRLAEAAPEQQRALHLDDRLPGAQGQPEGHPGLARPGEAGRRGHHAEPEDLRRRALELPGRLGLRLGTCRAARDATAREFVARAVPERPGARLGRARRDHDVRRARHRRRAHRAGRTRRCWPWRRSEGKWRSSCPSVTHPGRAAGGGGRRGRGAQWHAARAQAYLEFLYTPEAQEIAAQAPLPAADRRGAGEHRVDFPDVRALHDRPRFGGWAAAQKTHFADGGMFDQIYRAGEAVDARRRPRAARVLPGFGLSLGFTRLLPLPAGAAAAGAAWR